jgi:hypothetical protein
VSKEVREEGLSTRIDGRKEIQGSLSVCTGPMLLFITEAKVISKHVKASARASRSNPVNVPHRAKPCLSTRFRKKMDKKAPVERCIVSDDKLRPRQESTQASFVQPTTGQTTQM